MMDFDPTDLTRSRNELQKVADFLPYPFIIAEVINGVHLNTHLNEKFLEEISYTLDEIPTIEAWYEKAYPDPIYREQVIRNWDAKEAEHLKEGKIFVKMKSHVTCKNGTKRWYEIKASVVNTVHVVAFIDLDKEVALQEELKNINRNNDRMLSILGHDLRSPVANLMSLSDLAVNTEISKQEYTDLIHMVNEQSIQVLEMLDNTLNWAKLNFNAITLAESEIDLNAVVKNILLIYEKSYTSKNITVNISIATPGIVVSDLEMVTIIIRNLLSNAIKFTPQNGTITVGFVDNELMIRDSGIGMAPSILAEVKSQRFVSRNGTNDETGKGMGLQLILTLAEKISCELTIESAEYVGTEARLRFKKL